MAEGQYALNRLECGHCHSPLSAESLVYTIENHRKIIAELQSKLDEANRIIEQQKALLEQARNGLEWFIAEHPEDASSADGEILEAIDAAINQSEATK